MIHWLDFAEICCTTWVHCTLEAGKIWKINSTVTKATSAPLTVSGFMLPLFVCKLSPFSRDHTDARVSLIAWWVSLKLAEYDCQLMFLCLSCRMETAANQQQDNQHDGKTSLKKWRESWEMWKLSNKMQKLATEPFMWLKPH